MGLEAKPEKRDRREVDSITPKVSGLRPTERALYARNEYANAFIYTLTLAFSKFYDVPTIVHGAGNSTCMYASRKSPFSLDEKVETSWTKVCPPRRIERILAQFRAFGIENAWRPVVKTKLGLT